MAVSFRSSSIRGVDDVSDGQISIPVPSGATAGDIVIAYVGQWSPTQTPAAPAGFTFIAVVDSGGGSPTRVGAYWKRLTGADAGSYTFTQTADWSNGGALCFIGGLAAGNPIVDFATGAIFGTAYPDLIVTADAGSGLAWVSYNENADGTHDPPDGYTGIQAQNYGMAAWDIAESTGDHTATGATPSDAMSLAAILVAIAPEAAGAGSTAELAGTLPAIVGAFDVVGVSDIQLAGTLPALTGAFDVEATSSVELAGTLPAIQGSFDVGATSDVQLTGTLPALTGAFDLGAGAVVAFAGTLPPVEGSFGIDAGATAELAGQLPAIEGAFQITDANLALVELVGILPAIQGSFDAASRSSTVLAGDLPALTGSFEIVEVVPSDVVLAGTLPALTGAFDINSGGPPPGRPIQPFAAPRGIMPDAPERPTQAASSARAIQPSMG